ncbi:HAMP domain-containing sensor histidine kinase [Larkinella soli]|uniref:HAMP domain-containing sensor histidine kinase n=1 Tax=Larkinella soli TaxID=1770527 RepID=UPI000FFBD6E7|nr:ATP-binding protein [Larkinella soli]
MNIRTRLTVLFALLVGSIILLFSLTIYYLFDQYREREFYDRLHQKAITTVQLLEDVPEVTEEMLRRIEVNYMALYRGHVTIYQTDNRILYTTDSKPEIVSPQFLEQVRNGREIFQRNGELEMLGVRYIDHRKQVLVVVATAIDRYGFSKLEWLREILLISWLSSMVIVLLAGWFFAGDALKPVSDIIDQVNAISATNIHARLRIGRARDELAKLAATFNEMLNRLEDAFILQKNFVSHASHELRTPLTVMMGQVDVALMQPRSEAEYRQVLEGVLEEGKKMNNLVNGLLELAHANSDAATISFRPVRVDELLWHGRALLTQKNPEYHIEIEYEQLPENEEDLIVLGEEALLQMAFQNLMENGCKYSHDHRIVITLVAENDHIRLNFTDHGTGIPPDDLPHLFEPFFRSEITSGVSGHGIGLALTHRIITIHKGQIDIESTLGQGTTVRVALPALQPSSARKPVVYELDK